MKYTHALVYMLSLCASLAACAIPARCIILLDKNDFAENVGRCERFFLMSKLQAAIEEQSTPILVHASLWNSFIERRTFFAFALHDNTSKCAQVYNLYQNINERIAYWHDYYRPRIDDIRHMKELILQHINQEFYVDAHTLVTDFHYQLLLNYLTPFKQSDWRIYTNQQGLFLLLPEKYCAALGETSCGFKTSSLTRIENPEQAGSLYFASRLSPTPISQQLCDFFITDTDVYSWDIVLSGHGGYMYDETMNDDGTLNWQATPVIADLALDQFHAMLTFFNDRVSTHSLHYSSCFAGGLHSVLPFQQSYRSYNYALMYACLTDCLDYCVWRTNLPSRAKKFLSTDDLTYNADTRQWCLPIKAPYTWNHYFTSIATTNFNAEDMTSLIPALESISGDRVENGCCMCIPHGQRFYNLYPSTFAKISDHMVTLAQEAKKPIYLGYADTVLVESASIEPTVVLRQLKHFISIKPGHAVHRFKKITTETFIDIADAFWQPIGQWFDKTFLIEELSCPADFDMLMRKYQYKTNQKNLTVTRILIHAYKDHLVRIFLTLNDHAYMFIVRNPDTQQYKTMVQAVVLLDNAARAAYEAEYTSFEKL